MQFVTAGTVKFFKYYKFKAEFPGKFLLFRVTGKLTSTTRRLGIWKKANKTFILTCVCKSGKQFFICDKTSRFHDDITEDVTQVSLEMPNLLCSTRIISIFWNCNHFLLDFNCFYW